LLASRSIRDATTATATSAGLRLSTGISVAAMLVFNFFMLPPFDTLTIADPQN
jgi:K+-sensing histidine kinase KdpD